MMFIGFTWHIGLETLFIYYQIYSLLFPFVNANSVQNIYLTKIHQLLSCVMHSFSAFIETYLTYCIVHLFKMYDSMFFSIAREVCKHHHNLIFEHFHHSKKKHHPYQQSLPIALHPTQPQTTTNLHSYRFSSSGRVIKWNHTMCSFL